MPVPSDNQKSKNHRSDDDTCSTNEPHVSPPHFKVTAFDSSTVGMNNSSWFGPTLSKSRGHAPNDDDDSFGWDETMHQDDAFAEDLETSEGIVPLYNEISCHVSTCAIIVGLALQHRA